MSSEKTETKMEETYSTVENSENNCELQWAEIQTKNKSVIIGSYY